jgi:hypothetical protein
VAGQASGSPVPQAWLARASAAAGDVDENLCAGQVGDRVLQLGGVVKQARAGVLCDMGSA